jgi:hypothetical protein
VAETTKVKLAGPTKPLGTTDIPQCYLPAQKPAGKAVYAPFLYGAATIQFADKRRGVDEVRKVMVLLPLDPAAKTIDWEQAKPTAVTQEQLLPGQPVVAEHLPLPSGATQAKIFTRWAKQFDRWLARTQRVTLELKADSAAQPDSVEIRPKRGGVTVNLVAIVWELTTAE